MKAHTVERREVYVRCPRCGDETSHRITHLRPGCYFGISYCSRCRAGIEGYMGDDGQVEIAVADEGKEISYLFVRVQPEEVPQFLIVSRPMDDFIGDSIRLRNVAAVRYRDDPEMKRAVKFVAPADSGQTDEEE